MAATAFEHRPFSGNMTALNLIPLQHSGSLAPPLKSSRTILKPNEKKSMTCEVIKKEGIAHLPPLSFRSHHVSVPPQLCLRRAGLYAAFRLRCLMHVAALFAGAVVSACFILFQECYREPEAARQELMLVPNYCRKPPLPLCSTKDRSQGHMSNLNILCPH